MAAEPGLRSSDCLLIVDVQKDFCPGGALGVEDGDAVAAALDPWIGAAKEAGAKIVASRDWHPQHHVSFEERGGPWPPHCVQDTLGAELHPRLRLPDEAEIISKGTNENRDAYSAFDGTGLADELRDAGVERVVIGGLTLDYCVKETALDAREAGFETLLIAEATRPVEARPGDGRRAIEEMKEAGVEVLEK
ncbi:MAG: nicotinamidase [Polyangia bacterium]